FEPGFPWFVSVARGDVRLYLSEHTGDAPPGSLAHLYVGDIDAVSAEFGIPVDEEGLAGRECDIEDPGGNRLRIATRRSWSARSRDPLCRVEHLARDRLEIDARSEEAGRDALDDTPFPDRRLVEAGAVREPPRALVEVALERVLAHQDPEVVLGLDEQAVRV